MAIYQSKFLSPFNTTIDGTIINPFSFTCQGSTITKYNAKIYRVSDNVQVYTTGDVTLSPVKYNNDIVTFNVPALTVTNGTQYKWEVITYENASFATSFQVTFWANASATLTMTVPSTITTQKYTFTATYTQTNNVPIQYFYFVLSDSDGELKRTDLIFSGNISYTFDGFVSGNNYSIQVFGVTNTGAQVESVVYDFDVLYTQPNIVIAPDITQDCKTSLVDVLWDDIVLLSGTPNGNITYVDSITPVAGKSLSLGVSDSVSWVIPIPVDFTCSFVIKIPKGQSAVLVRLMDDYYFGYDGGLFYAIINGVRVIPEGYYNNLDGIYFIVLRPTKFNITKIENVLTKNWSEEVLLKETSLEITTTQYEYVLSALPTYDVGGVVTNIGVSRKEVII